MVATIRPLIDAQIIPKRKTPKIKSNSNAGNRRDAQSANFARKRIKTGISTPPAVRYGDRLDNLQAPSRVVLN